MGQLQGKVAIITGAASGIGEAAVRLFVAEGAKVVMTDLQESGAAIAAELGSAAIFRVHDVTDEVGWPKIVDAALSHFGRLDVLFNNAAIRHVKPMMETTVADMERSFRINVIGPMLGMKAAYEALRASGKGSIINVASGNASGFSRVLSRIRRANSRFGASVAAPRRNWAVSASGSIF